VRNLGGADATVSFERYDPRWPYDQPTTAMTELLGALAALGSDAATALPALERLAEQRLSAAVRDELRAACEAIRGAGVHSCCHEAEVELVEPEPIEAPVVGTRLCDLDVELEDQTGRRESLTRFFHGKPAVVAFFYTRCDSPYKCSLTVTRLAALQALLEARGLAGAMRLAAMTYDPDFDLPRRLERYGRDRGVRFGDDVRFFRPTSGFDALAQRLALDVGYGPSTVNRHRIELFLLDAAGDVAASFTRLQWDPDAVLAAAEGLFAPAT
jgi:cytochrome oxidase Cu insertion factor (SCO1/SenC/PrrC family)